MAVTATQSKQPADTANIAVGRYLDTGTVANTPCAITTGFKPRVVIVKNVTSGDSYEWYEGMAAASAYKRVTAGDATIITSLGITVSDRGFTIGDDTDIRVSSEQLSWMAMG